MTVHVHHPAPLAHHPAALAAAIAALLVGGTAAGIAWEASRPTSPAPTAPAQHQPQVNRMVHGFVVSPQR
jgi:hypothetical protein